MANKKKVIVTGFEPFGEHTVNSSWVAVQELERLGLGKEIDLFVCEVPVEYQAVQNLLPSMWKEHQPQFVVHVGVSGLAKKVTLEQCGHNKGYKRPDNCHFCPESQCCMEDGPDCISSVLDMDLVCKRVGESDIGAELTVSKNAGRFGHFKIQDSRFKIQDFYSSRTKLYTAYITSSEMYLCDYTYYTSLYLGKGHAAFIHVPPLGKPYSSQDLGQALRAVIQEMLSQLELQQHSPEEHYNHTQHNHQ